MIIIIVAIIAVVLFASVSVFQLLLALGLPYGRAAYGGKHETLPVNLRIMSLVAIGIFVFAIIVVLDRVGIINIFNNPLVAIITLWILAGYSVLNTLMNFLSKSKWEKLIMTPISLFIAVCCLVLALAP